MYDLDTKEGMANAVAWTEQLVNHLKDGGVWAVPRSHTLVTITSKANKQVLISEGLPDPAIARVFKAMGWTVKHKET